MQKLLIAPCGRGDDYKYIKQFSEDIYGIDLSPIATKSCPHEMNVKTEDLLDSGYPNNFFDLIVSPLFFHHFVKIGFSPFLREFYRILKRGGNLIILDFSSYYPLFSVTRPMKKILRNPYGEVEDETPFRPKFMMQALKSNKFRNLKMQAATFSHCTFFIYIQKLINKTTKHLLTKWPFKLFGWMVLFWAEK